MEKQLLIFKTTVRNKCIFLMDQIQRHCHESFGVYEDHNGLVVGERVFEGQAYCRKFGPARRAAAGASATLQHPPPLVLCW